MTPPSPSSPPQCLLAIDPGKCAGWALFWTGWLWQCGTTNVAQDILPWNVITEAVCELPQVYRAAQSKGDPNDLIKVAVGVGRWQERAESRNIPWKTYLPNEWKGQAPKDVHHNRAMRQLSEEESRRIPDMAVSLRHNMMDAVALGLFHLGRLRR
jgi:hypothetical protein